MDRRFGTKSKRTVGQPRIPVARAGLLAADCAIQRRLISEHLGVSKALTRWRGFWSEILRLITWQLRRQDESGKT